MLLILLCVIRTIFAIIFAFDVDVIDKLAHSCLYTNKVLHEIPNIVIFINKIIFCCVTIILLPNDSVIIVMSND